MRLFGILAASLMATACGLSFNPDLPQSGDSDSGEGAQSGDGDIGIDVGSEDPCAQVTGTAGAAAGGMGGESPDSDAPGSADPDWDDSGSDDSGVTHHETETCR